MPNPAWRYNPFEVSICDTAGEHGDALTIALARALSDRFRVATVKDTVPPHRRDSPSDAIRLVRMDTHDVLSVPRDCAPATYAVLLDADQVLVQESEPHGPAILLVGDGKPVQAGDVIAYVADPAACPILPSDAPFFTTHQTAALAAHVIECLDERSERTPIYGLVLAGGRSTRMGRDKGALAYGDRPQAEHTLDLLREACRDAFVSVRREQSHGAPYDKLPSIIDRFDGFGPIGGVFTAMLAHPGAAWLVLACDMPNVDGATLRALCDARDPFRAATCFRASDGAPEPLCAIYEPKSARFLAAQLGEGAYSLRRMLQAQRVCVTDAPPGDALIRANTPEEFAAIQAQRVQT